MKKNRYIKGYSAVADPLKLLSIDPVIVTHSTEQLFYFFHHEKWGIILDGSWDQETYPVEESPKVESLIDRFERGLSWEETTLYDEYTSDGMSHEDVISHLRRFDELFADLERRYKTSFELPSAEFMEEVCVCIGRDGEIIHSRSGRHRLMMAKILELNEIPVRVMARHKQWQHVRETCLTQMETEGRLTGEMRQFADHPDLVDLLGDQVKGSFS